MYNGITLAITGKDAKQEIPKLSLYSLIITAICLVYVAGLFVPILEVNNACLGTNLFHKQFSLCSLIIHGITADLSKKSNVITLCCVLFLFIIIFPIIEISVVLLVWWVPLECHALFALRHLLYVLDSFNCIEVMIVSIFISSEEMIPHIIKENGYSDYIVTDYTFLYAYIGMCALMFVCKYEVYRSISHILDIAKKQQYEEIPSANA
jgi:hypothetical protein